MTFRVSLNEGIVWVTGASSGIGRAVALEFARRGYIVVATARSDSKLIELAIEHENIRYIPADVTNRKSMEEVVRIIEQLYGPIVLAFLNAGGFFAGKAPFDDAFRKTIDLNFGGIVNCLEQLVPSMIKNKKGHIVLMSSVTGFGGMPYFSPDYIVAKGSVILLAESIMHQLESKNIRIQIVTPSFIDTGLISKVIFNTPFIVETEKAAKIIVDGIHNKGFEITFPKITSYFLKLLNLFPYPIYFKLIKYVMKKINKRG